MSHMMKNQRLFQTLVELPTIIADHIWEKRMNFNGSWATEVEIFDMAHLLATDIYTYTLHGGIERWTWMKFSGSFMDRHLQVRPGTGIYLQHTNRNHYEVVLDVTSQTTPHSGPLTCMEKIMKEFQHQNRMYCKKSHQSIHQNHMETSEVSEKIKRGNSEKIAEKGNE